MASIIDTHSHYMPPEVAQQTAFFKAGWSDIDNQLRLMYANGIEKALLLYPTSDAHLNLKGWQNLCDIYNPALAKIVKAHPERFIGAGIIPVDTPSNYIKELSRITD